MCNHKPNLNCLVDALLDFLGLATAFDQQVYLLVEVLKNLLCEIVHLPHVDGRVLGCLLNELVVQIPKRVLYLDVCHLQLQLHRQFLLAFPENLNLLLTDHTELKHKWRFFWYLPGLEPVATVLQQSINLEPFNVVFLVQQENQILPFCAVLVDLAEALGVVCDGLEGLEMYQDLFAGFFVEGHHRAGVHVTAQAQEVWGAGLHDQIRPHLLYPAL